ncbi:MAG: bleomycin resistance protein [Pseudohongiellaceae bacterium]
MPDRVTANLPSRVFDATAAFYAALGFKTNFKNDDWMILSRGPLELEFFRHDQNPRTSCFSACIRVDDLDDLYSAFQKAELPSDCAKIPRISPPEFQHGLRMFALVDPDGNLLRCIENQSRTN